MRPLSFPHGEAVALFAVQAEAFVAATTAMDELRLLGASGCHGWSVLDLVVHVRAGLQEMAIGTTARTASRADADAASYWSRGPGGDGATDPVDRILALRRAAAASARPASAVAHLRDVTTAAVRAVTAVPEGVVDFQDRRMTTGDFVATWVVELAIHQLDLALTADEPGGAVEVPGLAWTRATLEALAEATLPPSLDDRAAVLLGLGRVPLPDGVTTLGGSWPVTL